MWFLTFDDIKWYFFEAWVLTEIAEKYFQGNFCDQWSIGTDYEKFLSNSVDLMKNILWWEMCAAAAERSWEGGGGRRAQRGTHTGQNASKLI